MNRFDDLELIRNYSRQYNFYVKSTDTGPDDRITPHALTACIQEAASLDALSLGFGADDLDKNDIVWILIRNSVRLFHKAGWRDEIVVDTWTNGVSGVFALRDFAVTTSAGVPVAKATTSWILADRTTKRPLRTDVLESERMKTIQYSCLGFEAPRIKLLPRTLQDEPVLSLRVGASDIDRNDHVNNTRYIAWCQDVIDVLGKDPSEIRGFDINYISEVIKGEEVILYGVKADKYLREPIAENDAYLVIGKHASQDRISFSALIYI